jgi:glutamyl/glutaminyl-tRNA synthetase
MYDLLKLKYFNEQWLRKLSDAEIADGFSRFIDSDHPYQNQTSEWKETFSSLMKEKVQLFSDINEFLPIFFDASADEDEQYKEAISWETTPSIKIYLKEEIDKVEGEFVSVDLVGEWMNYLKKELKIKGKPLFMGTRVCLTGRAHGPDLKTVVSLTPISIIKERLK